MVDMYFLKPFENNKNLSIKIPEIIKGMAKPKAVSYTHLTLPTKA